MRVLEAAIVNGAFVLSSPTLTTDIYETVIKDVGLLAPDQAQRVTGADAAVRRLDWNLSRHSRKYQNGTFVVKQESLQLVALTTLQGVQKAVLSLSQF